MSLRAPRALLFDLDGTLIDSVADLAAALNHVRALHGAAGHDEATVRSFVGDGAWRLVQRGIADLDLAVEPALAEFRAYYGQHCLDRTVAYPGIEAMLAELPAGIPLAIVSNKPLVFCERIAEGLGWSARFRAVLGVHDGVAGKPAIDLLVLAARRLKSPLADCWMIGDSPNDLRAARAAGCVSVAVGWGLVDEAILRAESADLWIQTPDELLDALD